MDEMTYYDSNDITKEIAIEQLRSSDRKILTETLIDIVNSIDNPTWILEVCNKFAYHADYWVAKTAINCIGDLVRIHKYFAIKEIKTILKRISKERKELKDVIKDVKSDIRIYSKR